MRCAMLFNPNSDSNFDRLAERVRLAPEATPELFSAITNICARLQVLKRAGKTYRLDRLVEAGAWTDAAFAFLEFELPAWKLRRLLYEDGEWYCSLSKQPNLPGAFDETADGNHEVLSLAILNAFMEALCRVNLPPEQVFPTVPQMRPTLGQATCCDNFS
jgi:hypothetical protein